MKVIHQHKEYILEGIKENNTGVLKLVYKDYFPGIKRFIENNSGNTEDARDIFQEAILIVYRKLKMNELILTGSFKNYLYSVCKLLWLKQLEKRKKSKTSNGSNFNPGLDFIDDVTDLKEQNDRYRLYWQHFEGLGDDCQKVLRLFLDKVPLKQIADIMGYSSEQYAKKKKFQCKEALVRRIKNDDVFKEIT